MKKNNTLGKNLTEKVPIKHLLLIMRTTLILLFTCVFCSMAETGFTQNARVTINKRNATIREVINEIEKQSDYLFIYNNRVNTNEKVTVRAKQKAVSDVLNSMLNEKEMDYTMEGNHIILSVIDKSDQTSQELLVATTQQQKKQLTGTVVDETDTPVIGANIVELGTTNGTVTDMNGRFSLQVEEDALIRVSYIGYLDQEISTAGRNNIKVSLAEDMQSLDELVVVGYGVQKKRLVTGANVSVSNETLQNQHSTNALEAMQAFAPGVNITQASGMPGEGFQVNIRGLGTIGNSAPLYVIDGVAGGDINTLNPSDIESIDVLKDAASAAIYGARAANGVILVTTKTGHRGRIEVSYDGYYGIQSVAKMPDLLNAKQYMEIYNEERVIAQNNPDAAIDFSEKIPGLYQQIMSGQWNGTDWMEEIRNQNAPIQNHWVFPTPPRKEFSANR